MQYALSYANQGYAVFPLQPNGKQPLTPHGFKDATRDPEVIRQWWEQWPDANVGIATGRVSGIIVLNVDRKHGVDGVVSAAELELPDTLVIRTPSGGYHLFFKAPPAAIVPRRIGVKPGLDVLGEGGYVVAAGSWVDGAVYEIVKNRPIVECPEILVNLALRSDGKNGAAPADPLLGVKVAIGARNQYLTRIAGKLRHIGFSAEELITALLVINTTRLESPLAEAEVRRTGTSVAKYDPDPMATERADLQAEGPPLTIVPMHDIATVTPIPTRFVLDLLLPRDEVTLLAGHGDTGKTLLALAIACHVACGKDFAGLPVIGGRVLFVSLEDSGDLIKLRIRRIAAEFGLDLAAIANRLTVMDATQTDDTALAYEIAQAGIRRLLFSTVFDQIEAAAAGYDLIVIDNASDAFDANEIERRMVRRFVRVLKRKIAIANHAAVLLLAHIDKHAARHGASGETYSGSTAWHNSVRSRLALVQRDASLELIHEKHNLSKGLEHPIMLQRSELGVLVPLSSGETAARSRADIDAVLTAITAAQRLGANVPTAVVGAKTITAFLATRPEIPEDLADDRKRMRSALNALEREGLIWTETYRDDQQRKQRERYRCAE